jgi:hypothetical protein
MKVIGLVVQLVCVLAAASMLGNWFLAEFKKFKAVGKPWYAVYLSPPGVLIVAIILLLPLILGL